MLSQIEACDGGFVCLVCGKTTKYMSTIKRHIKEAHMAPRQYFCPPCNTVFYNRAFYTHVRTKHPAWQGINLDKFIHRPPASE